MATRNIFFPNGLMESCGCLRPAQLFAVLVPRPLRYTFSTRSFLIRYCEEEVELGDVGQFRLELGPAELLVWKAVKRKDILTRHAPGGAPMRHRYQKK